jgi:hypothetical protein
MRFASADCLPKTIDIQTKAGHKGHTINSSAIAGIEIQIHLQRNDRNSEQGFIKLANCDPSASIPVDKVAWTCQGATHMVRKNRDVPNPHGGQDKADDHHTKWWLRSREEAYGYYYSHDNDREKRYRGELHTS